VGGSARDAAHASPASSGLLGQGTAYFQSRLTTRSPLGCGRLCPRAERSQTAPPR
jgi:hypothetical protein